jgi:predicted DNA-binding transcriptional regulator AlpA
MLTEKQVCGIVGVSRQTLIRWRKSGDFPQPFKFGPKLIRWHKSVVEKWMASR